MGRRRTMWFSERCCVSWAGPWELLPYADHLPCGFAGCRSRSLRTFEQITDRTLVVRALIVSSCVRPLRHLSTDPRTRVVACFVQGVGVSCMLTRAVSAYGLA